jgi:hypothetical protein
MFHEDSKSGNILCLLEKSLLTLSGGIRFSALTRLGPKFLCVLKNITKTIMLDKNGMTRSDRVLGRAASWVFWAIIGSISLMLKVFYSVRDRSSNMGKPIKSSSIIGVNAAEIEVQHRTNV